MAQMNNGSLGLDNNLFVSTGTSAFYSTTFQNDENLSDSQISVQEKVTAKQTPGRSRETFFGKTKKLRKGGKELSCSIKGS